MIGESTALKGIEKVVELLKSSGTQTAFIAVALAAYWWLVHAGFLPPFDPPWILHVVAVGFLMCVALTLAAIASWAAKPLGNWITSRRSRAALQRRAEDAIPFLTDREQIIIGHLLHYRKKVFDADSDGGYAASLLGRGFIAILARHGQTIDMSRVPMVVPEPVWEVWERNKDKFPHRPEMDGKHEVHPWRIPWMDR